MNEEEVEVISFNLAVRIYLYRLFHIVFGATPSDEVMEALTAKETFEAFNYLEKRISDLKNVTNKEVKLETIRKAIRELESLKDKNRIQEMKSAYTSLFLIPGDKYVHPWESTYIGKENLLFQESTLDVRDAYKKYGFQALKYKHFPEDHIAMMLSFLSQIGEKTYKLFCNEQDSEALVLLNFQYQFIKSHIYNWLPELNKELYKNDPIGTYHIFLQVLEILVEMDLKFIQDIINKNKFN